MTRYIMNSGIRTDMSFEAGVRTSHGWGYAVKRAGIGSILEAVAAQAVMAEATGYGTDVRFAYRSPMANRPTPKRLHKGRKRNNGMAKFKSNRGGTFQKRLFA